MITENKYRWMIWAIVVLAVMNLSTLATIIYQQVKSNQAPFEGVHAVPRHMDAEAERFSGRFFRDHLHLSKNQMDDFRSINKSFRKRAFELSDSLGKMRFVMLEEMEAENPDTAYLNSLSRKIGLVHADLKIITYKYYLDLKKICTPEQQVLLKDLFGRMFQNDSRIGLPPRDGRHERQPGMGRNRNM